MAGVVIDSLEKAKEILRQQGKVIGLGVTAFPRIEVYDLVVDYEIVCFKESADLRVLRKLCPIKSLQRDFGLRERIKFNTLTLLSYRPLQQYLLGLRERPALFVYKASAQTAVRAEQLGLKLLANPGGIRDELENKETFRQVAKRAGLELIEAESMLVEELSGERFRQLRRRFGKVVLQLTSYSRGGGIGTFFVESDEEFDWFKAYVERRQQAGKKIERVNAVKYVAGVASSVAACVTRHGVLVSRLQRQVIDAREVVGLAGRSGIWCGHDWEYQYSERACERAEMVARRLGEYIYSQGYRGIFGVDMVVDDGDNVYPIECNSRYTGAFPILSQIQKVKGEIPMDGWHLLEFFEVDYEMDFNRVQESYRQPRFGGQLLMHNLERKWVKVGATVPSGVYRWGRRGVEYQREGYSLAELKQAEEVVLTDGVPLAGTVLKPGERVARLISPGGVLDKEGKLRAAVVMLAQRMYQKFKLVKTEKPMV